MTKNILLLLAVIATAALSSSCATVAGMGQDVQKLGSSVQSSAVRSSQR